MNPHWRQYFTSIILERGYDYYADGHVTTIRKTDDGYIGIVSGTEDYSVDLRFTSHNGSETLQMDCSCPYADDGSYCKHMAAMLYAIEKQDRISGGEHNETEKNLATSRESGKSIQEVVDELAPDIVRKELISILESDRNLSASFLMKYARDEKSISDYIYAMRETAEEIRMQCSDHHGFVDWRNASDYVLRLATEVLSNLQDFTSEDEEEASAAFNVSLYVYDMFVNTDIDDDGDSQIFADDCISVWEEILSNTESDALREHIYRELTREANKIGFGEYMSERIEDFLSDHFKEGQFIAERLGVLDARIERFSNDASWSGESKLSRCVIERIALMEELGYSRSDIDEYKKMFWHLPDIRKMKMMELENNGEMVELIRLLEESRKMDHGSPGLVRNYSEKLIECYRSVNNTEKVKEELYLYLIAYSRGNTVKFIEYKQYFSEDVWLQKREEIFDILLKDRIDIKPLLALEGLKDRLFDSLVKKVEGKYGVERISLLEVRKYEDILRPEYDRELLGVYSNAIGNMAKHAGGRSHYKEIVAAIRWMLVYPGGKEVAKTLLEQWRSQYSNRPAMKEELRVLHGDIYQ
jgi:hypothetical protein